MPNTLGIVIVSFNTRDLLGPCLASVQSEVRPSALDATVWLVDNASSDGSAEFVARAFPDVRIAALDRNVGFAAANNVLLNRWIGDLQSCPDWVLLLNPDTELQPGALGALIQALVDEPGAGLAGPHLLYPDGRFQHGAFQFPGLGQTLLDLFPVARLYDTRLNGRYPRARYEAGMPFAVDFLLGACMLVRGQALAHAGPLDAGFFMYCEEIDWARRFRAAGYRVLCVPLAVVIHHAGASTGQLPGPMFVQLWRSRLRLFRKHEPPWRQRLLVNAVRLGLTWRLIADGWATSRGHLTTAERAARADAYRAIQRS